MASTLADLQESINTRGMEAREVDAQKTGIIDNKNREIGVLTKNLTTSKDQVTAFKSSITNLENEKKGLEDVIRKKTKDIKDLQQKVEQLENKMEFKSSLERSFESLQVSSGI